MNLRAVVFLTLVLHSFCKNVVLESNKSLISTLTTGDKSSNDKLDKEVVHKAAICEDNCKRCYGKHCFECKDGYQRIGYACVKMGKGCSDPQCLDCSADVCYRCVEGFKVNNIGTCSWRGPDGCEDQNCNACRDTKDTCTDCKPGFQLINGSCKEDACSDENCRMCDTDTKNCLICNEGYQSRLGTCLELGCLDQNCRRCSPSGGTCYMCTDGFYADLNKGACLQCPDKNCLDCNTAYNGCKKCKDGYFTAKLLNNMFGCRSCNEVHDHCSTCSSNAAECYSCEEGYYLEHGHCIMCPSKCAECKSPWYCDKCMSGYDLMADGVCLKDIVTLNSVKSGASQQLFISLPLTFTIAILSLYFILAV